MAASIDTPLEFEISEDEVNPNDAVSTNQKAPIFATAMAILDVRDYSMFDNPVVGAIITIPKVREILTAPGTQVLHNRRIYTKAMCLTAAMNFANSSVGIMTASNYAAFANDYEAKLYLADLFTEIGNPPFIFIRDGSVGGALYLIDGYALYFIRWGCPTLSSSMDICNFLMYQLPSSDTVKKPETDFKKQEIASTFLETSDKILAAMSQEKTQDSNEQAAAVKLMVSQNFICIKKIGVYNESGDLVSGGSPFEQFTAGVNNCCGYAFVSMITED
ncbi:hypothetical protein HK100_008322 [Physocladia obscura]|uniref:Uncharacterized protein n=1 Tax=Physocladia obscura TaxID=109957 RepID=A0AAD5XI07_9FUNG|nr:hypothetical protein HK100_008322 [Physocladia obscura]